METTEQIVPPSSKQERILIWRHEVATANLDNEDAVSRTDGAAGSSATSTTTSSSSSRSALVLARGRHLLSRVAHKLSLRSSGGSGSSRFWRSSDESPNGVTRTAMYASLSPDNMAAWRSVGEHENEAAAAANDDNILLEGDASADGQSPRDAALREKQDRLMRAAKLLDRVHPVQE